MFNNDDERNEARQLLMELLPEEVKDELKKEVRVRCECAERLISEFPDQPGKRLAMAVSLVVGALKERPSCTVQLAEKIGRLAYETDHANLTDLADGYGVDPVTGVVRRRGDGDEEIGACDDSDEDDPTVIN